MVPVDSDSNFDESHRVRNSETIYLTEGQGRYPVITEHGKDPNTSYRSDRPEN